MPRLTPLAAALPAAVPFVGPETLERRLGRPFRARLGANESVFGPSPAALAAIRRAADEAWQYGDPEAFELKAALARHHGVTSAHVMVGEGIDGLLGLLVRLLVGPGTPVVSTLGTYPTFAYHVAGHGGRLHAVPYLADQPDLDGLAAAARATDSPLIYLANPDNPMGLWHTGGAIARLLDRLPPGTLLCLDEAYADTAPAEALPPLDPDDPRLIRMRTFSKAHGLAGLRVGYALGHPDLIDAFNRVRNHFGVGRVAQAGALAALGDRLWLADAVAAIVRGRDGVAAIARDHGLAPLGSATNFVTIDCGGDAGVARSLVAQLAERGVFVRMPFHPPQDRCIRVSAGGPQDLEILAAALPEALAATAREASPPK